MKQRSRISGGFTLVELMVSLVIGLIIMAALIALYMSNIQAARFQTAVQQMQENGRFAVDVLSRTTRMAGYDDPLTTTALPTPVVVGSTNASGAIFYQTGLLSSGDTVAIRFEGGTGIRDCQGVAVNADSWVLNLYAVSTDNNLVCATQTSAGATNNITTLAEGVEDMRVFYGVDKDADGIADKYVGAGDVTDWSEVVSMQFALLVNSVSNALLEPDTVCMGCTFFNGTNDKMLRAEFLTTIGIRN